MSIPRLSIWDENDCRRVHEATLTVLETTGVEVRHERARELLAAFLFFAVAGFFRGDYLVEHPSPLVVWPSVVLGALFLGGLCVLLVLRARMRRLWRHADPITQAEYAAAGPYVPERKSLYSWGSKHEPTKPPSRPDEDPFDTPTGL